MSLPISRVTHSLTALSPVVSVSASGYLQGAVFDKDQIDYGHQIRDHSMGSLHDHLINYKVRLPST